MEYNKQFIGLHFWWTFFFAQKDSIQKLLVKIKKNCFDKISIFLESSYQDQWPESV